MGRELQYMGTALCAIMCAMEEKKERGRERKHWQKDSFVWDGVKEEPTKTPVGRKYDSVVALL